MKSALSAFVRDSGDQVAETGAPTATRPIPGPAPLSLEALKDVSVIFFEGLHVAQLKFSEKYGPVCRFANPASLNGATSWVFINSPENIQHVCATNVRNYSRRYLPDIYTYVTHGKGILGSQDEYNARHRRLCSGPFRNKWQLQRFSSVVVERSKRLVDIFSAAAAADPSGAFTTDVATQTQRLTLDVVGLVAFSHDFACVEQVQRDLAGATAGDGRSGVLQDRVLWAVNTFGEVLAQVFITPLPLLKAMDRLGAPHLRQLGEAVSVMRAAMLDVIAERRASLAAGGRGRDDLLQALLTATEDDGRGLSDEELWEDVHDIMGAGHETTATTTAALLYCISAHPHVRQRLEEELDAVLADGEAPTYESLERMPYLQACAKEVMRLYPAIPVFPREAARPDVLPTGHGVAAGDVVFMSSYALGRSEAVWGPDVLEFDPDRFSPEREARQHRFQWLPFGAGPRMCLGASFAQMSVALMAATLLQRFRFTPLAPCSPLIPVGYDITMNFGPSGGLRMRVAPRQRGQQQ
ncbi:hypothetical protein CHLRE_01g003850v5 [Chlamydomonas reinhardtii]|uniref:Cytochrome P450 n=1 Tax=Chlamydomonas reinhardtii TaxID=3055 RepID=A0A2K3E4W6_CHLRE|nr:uncharacterized protein CHLRE_01g003850v5 [Chlamydomonas reinhardtii]PNW87838.1 hypothetical protein CHLRE_01g003850v5 [Chlamydomonas reinhardtii]